MIVEKNNLLKRTSAVRYSFLWQKHRDLPFSQAHHFKAMQHVIPEDIVRGKVGLDLGCGCGWDTLIMARDNPGVRIIGLDISQGVYNVHRLSPRPDNLFMLQASIEEIPLKSQVCDFIYSFGVLHHTPDYKRSFAEIGRILKNNGLCVLYLYEDHSENRMKYYAIKLTSFFRHITVKIPSRLLYILCYFFAPLVFAFFSLPSKIMSRFSLTENIAAKMPFNFASSPFALKGDLFDRFSAPVEHRFSRENARDMFTENGFYNVQIARLIDTAGWVVWGYKNNA